jgi:metal-responsive CopG/Arc/MetJ family transcriptional regulator
MKDLEAYIDEAIKNIRSDRAITTALLMELMDYMKKDDERKEKVGVVAAKYVETLQRSNEQLVKVSALLQKKAGSDQGLTDEDKSELFDLIKDSNNG